MTNKKMKYFIKMMTSKTFYKKIIIIKQFKINIINKA